MKLFAIGAAALVSLAASSAVAQTAVTHGAPISGLCVFYNQQALAQSTAGQAVQARMEQLAQEVQGEMAPYATAVQTEFQALQSAGSTLPAEQLNQRRQALQQRAQEAQVLEQTRENELRYTLAEQRRLMSEAIEPILISVYQQKQCSILLDRESVFVMNPAMDVTGEVIQRLNSALPTLTFNRMAVPAQAQAQ